jgi:hypothetical protein
MWFACPDSPSDRSHVQAAGQVPGWRTHRQLVLVYRAIALYASLTPDTRDNRYSKDKT